MESEKFVQKNLISSVASSSRILVIGMIFSVAFFLLLIDSFRTYTSEISILISAKSEMAAKSQNQIVNNIVELPKTLNFYDRMLRANPDMRDVAAGQTADQRKAKWNQMLSVERVNFDASVIKIAITAPRQADSITLANKTTRALFDTAAFYYNVKDDVDLRIVDGPITRSQIQNWYALLVVSAIAGFVVSWIIEHLIFGKLTLTKKRDLLERKSFFDFKKTQQMPVENELESLNNLYQNEEAEKPFVFEEKNEDEKQIADEDISAAAAENFQEIKKITKKLEPSKYPNFPEMPARNASHIEAGGPVRTGQASAPDNLPIADDDFLASYNVPSEQEIPGQQDEKIVEQSNSTVSETDEVEKEHKEPTPEELKKRLNELLRG